MPVHTRTCARVCARERAPTPILLLLYSSARSRSDGAAAKRIVAAVEGGVRERFAYAAELASLLPQERTAVRELLDLWADWWHDLLVVGEGAPEAVLDEAATRGMRDDNRRFSRRELAGAIGEVLKARGLLELNANPRLVLEAMMLALPAGGARPSTGSG